MKEFKVFSCAKCPFLICEDAEDYIIHTCSLRYNTRKNYMQSYVISTDGGYTITPEWCPVKEFGEIRIIDAHVLKI